ncbi:MAG: hypothetical protein JNJ49_03375 [Bdellovibrionaceae bacterium]|nr:hypothetical protein [Pseudobdellovibrionaceae bacterium]
MAWDTVVFVPEALVKLWDLARISNQAQGEFIRKCEADTTNACKRNLIAGIPTLERKDPSKIHTSEILRLRDAYLNLANQLERNPVPKSLWERAEESERLEKLRTEAAAPMPRNTDPLEALANLGLKALEKVGVKWDCYNSFARSEMLCYAAGAATLGIGGTALLAKAIKVAGKGHVGVQLAKVTQLSINDLKAGKHFQVHFMNSTRVEDLTFLRAEGDTLIFRNGNKAEVSIAKTDIAEIRAGSKPKPAKDTPNTETAKSGDRNILDKYVVEPTAKMGEAVQYMALGGMFGGNQFRALKLVTRENGVTVLSNIKTDPGVASQLVKTLKITDANTQALGFRVPETTRVLIQDKALFPNMQGPHAIPGDIMSTVHLRDVSLPESQIAMKPILMRPEAARDSSVLVHERTHTILHATYSPESYVNTNRTIQEAFADILAADQMNSPVMGLTALGETKFIRNIATREAAGDVRAVGAKNSVSRNSILDIDAGSYHDNSLLYSNALWRIRETIGQSEFRKVLKPIVDDLNLHSKPTQFPESPSAAEMRQDFQFFLASTRKTLEERGQTRAVQEMDRLADELKIGSGESRALSHRLQRATDRNIAYAGERAPVHQVIAYHVGIAGRLAVEATLIYQAGTATIDRLTRPLPDPPPQRSPSPSR